MPLADSVAVPNVLTNPGILYVAALGSTEPTHTVAGGVFTDAWPVAWIPLGATTDGSEFAYGTSVEAVTVAEFTDPIRYETTDSTGTWTFTAADYVAQTLKLAYNGGAGAVVATSGTGATALYTVEPVELGDEVRIMLGWESSDATVRRIARRCLQGGDASSAHRKAPDLAGIPMTFNLERPLAGGAGTKSFSTYFAGADRA